MSRALCTREVLSMIIDHLQGDFCSLAAVIQVNHAWFACGVEFLWQAPPCFALAKITDDHRQLYASYVHRLSFRYNDYTFLPWLDGLAFPHLRYLSIDTSTCNPKECPRFLPYLVPSLLELALRGANLEPSMLALVPTRCPRLTKLTLAAPGPRISSHDLLMLLQSSPRIQHLYFFNRIDNVISDQVLTFLASRDDIKTLKLDSWMTSSCLRRISCLSPAPFPAVEDLEMKIILPAPQFVELFMSAPLRRLTLEVNYNPEYGDEIAPCHSILMGLSRFVHLESLHVCFCGYQVVRRDELKVFRHLKNLRSLRLEPDCGYPEENDLTDDDVDQLLSYLPFLVDFKLYFRSERLTARALHIISTRCPRMMWCEIPVDFIPGSKPNTVLFPRLETLIIEGIHPRPEAEEEDETVHR